MCCSIALQIISSSYPSSDNLFSLSLLYQMNGVRNLVNFFWPQYVRTKNEKLLLTMDELHEMYNINMMKPMIGQKIDQESCMVWSYLNESMDQMKSIVTSIIFDNTIILHKNDVIKWLHMDIFKDVKIKKIYIINSSYTRCLLCSRFKQHTPVTCTICRCCNIFEEKHYMYEYKNRTPFLYWCFNKKLISSMEYNYLCDKNNYNRAAAAVTAFHHHNQPNNRKRERSLESLRGRQRGVDGQQQYQRAKSISKFPSTTYHKPRTRCKSVV